MRENAKIKKNLNLLVCDALNEPIGKFFLLSNRHSQIRSKLDRHYKSRYFPEDRLASAELRSAHRQLEVCLHFFQASTSLFLWKIIFHATVLARQMSIKNNDYGQLF